MKKTTLSANYQKNLNIMRENLRRGMSPQQASSVVSSHEQQFKAAGLYDNDARAYIVAMRACITEHFAGIAIVHN